MDYIAVISDSMENQYGQSSGNLSGIWVLVVSTTKIWGHTISGHVRMTMPSQITNMLHATQQIRALSYVVTFQERITKCSTVISNFDSQILVLKLDKEVEGSDLWPFGEHSVESHVLDSVLWDLRELQQVVMALEIIWDVSSIQYLVCCCSPPVLNIWNECYYCLLCHQPSVLDGGVSEFDSQVALISEMFPDTCAMEARHCVSVSHGQIDEAVQLILHRQETGNSIIEPGETNLHVS